MTWRGLLCGTILLGGHGLWAAVATNSPAAPDALAADADNGNPYASIVDQNPFRLNPPPPPPAPPAPPPPALPTVIFGGTMNVKGHLFALFAVKEKKPDPANPRAMVETTSYLKMSVGDKTDPVELLKINMGGDEVEIMNSGTHVTLNLKDNGFEPKAGPGGTNSSGPAGMVPRSLPGGANPAMPAGQPGQPAAGGGGGGGGTIVGMGGGNAGGGGTHTLLSSGGGGVDTHATLSSGGPITQTALAANSSGHLSVAGYTAPQAATATGVTTPTMTPAGGGTVMPKNSTPPSTGVYNGPKPPMPPGMGD